MFTWITSSLHHFQTESSINRKLSFGIMDFDVEYLKTVTGRLLEIGIRDFKAHPKTLLADWHGKVYLKNPHSLQELQQSISDKIAAIPTIHL
ncbi:hypothetical protein TNCV_537801 [Trichonephila clavipes]|nr:hypothetical protein TNCV_537801 [Trichonephila clavipes]